MSQELEPYTKLSADEALKSNVETIVPFTYTSNFHEYGGKYRLDLSALSHLVMTSTVQLWLAHRESRIVIAGERTFGPDYESTSEIMADYILRGQRHRIKVPEIVELSGKKGFNNTPAQVEAIKKWRSDNESTDIPLAIAMSYHQDRLLTHAEAHGLPLAVTSAEDIWDHYYYPTPPLVSPDAIAEFSKSEERLQSIARISKKGRLLQLLSLVTGPRVQDAQFNETTKEYEIINTFARNRIKDLGI